MRWLARHIFKRALNTPNTPATDPTHTHLMRIGSTATPTPEWRQQVREDIQHAVSQGGWDWPEDNR